MPKVYVEMIRNEGSDPSLRRLTNQQFKCCLCGNEWIGFGNNPWPLGDVNTEKCCDFCNASQVIPARLNDLKKAAGVNPAA